MSWNANDEFEQNLKSMPMFPMTSESKEKIYKELVQFENQHTERRNLIRKWFGSLLAGAALVLVAVGVFTNAHIGSKQVAQLTMAYNSSARDLLVSSTGIPFVPVIPNDTDGYKLGDTVIHKGIYGTEPSYQFAAEFTSTGTGTPITQTSDKVRAESPQPDALKNGFRIREFPVGGFDVTNADGSLKVDVADELENGKWVSNVTTQDGIASVYHNHQGWTEVAYAKDRIVYTLSSPTLSCAQLVAIVNGSFTPVQSVIGLVTDTESGTISADFLKSTSFTPVIPAHLQVSAEETSVETSQGLSDEVTFVHVGNAPNSYIQIDESPTTTQEHLLRSEDAIVFKDRTKINGELVKVGKVPSGSFSGTSQERDQILQSFTYLSFTDSKHGLRFEICGNAGLAPLKHVASELIQ